MSDLIGSPEDRFCHDAALYHPTCTISVPVKQAGVGLILVLQPFDIEPCREKISLPGFRPGQTQQKMVRGLKFWI